MDAPLLTRDYLTLVALGGLLALDDRAGWQGLWSQPLFVALFVGVVVGGVDHALAVGLAMELVWLAILPMRGTRRPDAVTGSVVGAGTTCILVQQTGDPRFAFMAGMGAFVGLCTGEAAGMTVRMMGRVVAKYLGRFSPPADIQLRALTRRLDAYQAFTLLYIYLLEALMVAIALPISLIAVEAFTRVVDEPFAAGSRVWLELVPVLGAAAMIQHFWHRPANRFLAVAIVVVMVILWMQ